MVYSHRIQGEKSSTQRYFDPCMMRGTPIDLLLNQLKELGFELVAERNKIKIEGFRPLFPHQTPTFDNHSDIVKFFEESGKTIRDLKGVSVKIPLLKTEKALLKLSIKWENKQEDMRGKDIFYHPPRNVSIPINLESSCYAVKTEDENIRSGVLYITNKRILIYCKNKEKMNVHTFQVLTRIFYQDAIEIQYHLGDSLYKMVFYLKKEEFPLVQSVLMFHG